MSSSVGKISKQINAQGIDYIIYFFKHHDRIKIDYFNMDKVRLYIFYKSKLMPCFAPINFDTNNVANITSRSRNYTIT